MTWLIGIRNSWFKDKMPWNAEAAVVNMTRSMNTVTEEAYFIHAIDFFRPDQFPYHTHTPLRLAVSLVELRDNRLLRTRFQGSPNWSVFTRVASVDPLYIHGDDPYHKREAIAWQTSATLEAQFGELVPMFNPHLLHKALPLNEKQVFLRHQNLPGVLYLGVWLLANRELVCPEPHFDSVEWVSMTELVTSVHFRPDDYDTLSRTHLTCAVKS